MCKRELTEFLAELTEFAAELSEFSPPKQYSRNSIPPVPQRDRVLSPLFLGMSASIGWAAIIKIGTPEHQRNLMWGSTLRLHVSIVKEFGVKLFLW